MRPRRPAGLASGTLQPEFAEHPSGSLVQKDRPLSAVAGSSCGVRSSLQAPMRAGPAWGLAYQELHDPPSLEPRVPGYQVAAGRQGNRRSLR